MTQSKANPQENLFWWKTLLWRLFVSTNHQLKGRKLKKQKKTAKLSTPALLHISGTTALKKTMLCFCWKLDIRNEVITCSFQGKHPLLKGLSQTWNDEKQPWTAKKAYFHPFCHTHYASLLSQHRDQTHKNKSLVSSISQTKKDS